MYAGGLRLGGFDGNTVYNGNNNMGLIVANGYNVNLGVFGGNGVVMTLNNNGVFMNTGSSNNSCNFYSYPNSIYNSNGNSNSFSLNAACNTTSTPYLSPFITVQVPDGWNAINTIVTLACSGSANASYYNGSRITLDGSYGTNAGNGFYASSISFQSQYSGGAWQTNALFKTSVVSSVIVVSFYFYGTVFYDGLTSLISDETTKTNIITR